MVLDGIAKEYVYDIHGNLISEKNLFDDLSRLNIIYESFERTGLFSSKDLSIGILGGSNAKVGDFFADVMTNVLILYGSVGVAELPAFVNAINNIYKTKDIARIINYAKNGQWNYFQKALNAAGYTKNAAEASKLYWGIQSKAYSLTAGSMQFLEGLAPIPPTSVMQGAGALAYELYNWLFE